MNEENKPKAKISLDEVIKKSFFYWKSTLPFQFLATLFYFGLFFLAGTQLVQYYFGEHLKEFTPDLLKNPETFNLKIQKLLLTENGSYFQLIMSIVKAALFPLNIGFFKIYSKIDANEKIEFADFYEGFRGSNFFKFFGYALFWNVIFSFGMSFYFLPGIFWVFITVFVSPLLFFTPIRMIEAINISAKVALANWAIVLPCVIIATIFGYSGFFLFGIGFLFTYPFWNAVIYTLFQKYFKIKFV